MKTNKILICILSGLFISSGVYATNTSWINGLDTPAGWTINPQAPGYDDTISFSGPVGPITNSCFAMYYLGGTPTISINETNKVVELWFQGPAPQTCPFVWAPVCGLTGQFGPLSPGEWTFKSTQPSIAFEVHFLVTGPPVPVGKYYYVDMDSPGSARDGKSWNRAFKYVQDALAIATSGDTVYVAQGTYKPDRGGSQTRGDRMATFSPAPGVKLIGSCAGYGHTDPNKQDVKTYTTMLSGDLNGDDIWGILNRLDNSYQVMRVAGGMSAMVTINGFVITAGQADGPDLANSGAGLDIDGSNVMLVNTTITGNASGFGGGISCKNAKLSMWNCKINGNNAAIYGGGLYNYASDVDMANCLMTGNTASLAKTTGGSAIHNLGGSLHISDCTIADNSISTNSAEGNAIVSYAWKTPADCNLVIANSILYNGGSEILTNHSATISVSYCDVQGGFTGTGNISKNPQFTNAGQRDTTGKWADGDYTLKSISPCIDRGQNSLLPKDVPDLDNDGNVNEKLPIKS